MKHLRSPSASYRFVKGVKNGGVVDRAGKIWTFLSQSSGFSLQLCRNLNIIINNNNDNNNNYNNSSNNNDLH